MPELPEVETIARGLAESLVGARLSGAKLLWPDVLDSTHGALAAGELLSQVPGASVARIWRRAKALMVDIATSRHPVLHLSFHLRMTGRLTVEPPEQKPRKHTRLVFGLEDGRHLHFADTRKFGRCRAMTPEVLGDWPFFSSLGPEPLEISDSEFAALFSGRRGRMKALLLDQKFIAGIGNIYADESLFRAGIHPGTTADRVSVARLRALYGHLREVLLEAIDANGSSISDYVNAQGDAGAFQNDFRVYGRAGEPCRICEKPLTRSTVAGRTTVYCTKCQR